MKKHSKRLVIDASVAHAAGQANATAPLSKHCRDFLLNVRDMCHHIVMTPEIKEEWDRHKSRFAMTWWVSMKSKRKVSYLKNSPDQSLRKTIRGLKEISILHCNAMLKDCPLLEAALDADRIVVSADNNAQRLFKGVIAHLGNVKYVMWVHPELKSIQQWLEQGAPEMDDLRLGSNE